jgi:starch-binding outer membrane protein, SusD/RagB family
VTTFLRAPGRALSALLLLSLAGAQACTDLTESPKSSLTPENFYRNEAEVLGGLAAVYADLGGSDNHGTLWAYYNLSEISTDELIVPTRGPDWNDNGRWLEIHRQTWSAGSASGLDDIQNAWVVPFRGVARANIVLDALTRVDIPKENVVTAELRGLRALYYYMLMDMFGGVPIATDIEIKARPRVTRDSLFKFIESELKDIRTVLPVTRPPAENGRLTKGACDAILANMYVNAQVFTGTVSATGLTPGTARWQDASNWADSVINGPYTLATNWRSIFTADNDNSTENILVVKNQHANTVGLNFVMRALHYSQITPTPWNGFATLAETYRAFDAADQRRQIFLIGQQYNLDRLAKGDTVPVNDRQNNPLIFTDTIGDATNAKENEGPRIIKWPLDPEHLNENNANDFAYFRLGEMYLIKAEAQFRLGFPATALTLLNTLRARVFNPAKPLAVVNDSTLLAERLFELAGEAKRRQDLIRFDKYTQRVDLQVRKGKVLSDPYRILMPIPTTQLAANPCLYQNPGYGAPATPAACP